MRAITGFPQDYINAWSWAVFGKEGVAPLERPEQPPREVVDGWVNVGPLTRIEAVHGTFRGVGLRIESGIAFPLLDEKGNRLNLLRRLGFNKVLPERDCVLRIDFFGRRDEKGFAVETEEARARCYVNFFGVFCLPFTNLSSSREESATEAVILTDCHFEWVAPSAEVLR